MNWANPENLRWLWLIVIAMGLAVLAERRRRVRLQKISVATSNVFYPLTWLKYAVFIAALLMLLIGLARPRWGFEWTEVKRRGVDLAVAVDVSRSMLAKDIPPNRLERARREIVDLLGVMKGDRIALVAFAGAAFVQCPLTLDYGAAQMFLDYLDADLIPVQGTNIEDALKVSIGALENGTPGESSGKAVILITDGEEVSGDIAKAVAEAKEKGIKVYTVGIGSPEGAPIPEETGGFKKDESGNVIISRLAEGPLRELSEGTGGAYVRATAAGIGLENIYRSAIKGGLEEREFDSTREKLWYERFQWLMGLALLLLLIEYQMRDLGAVKATSLLLPILFCTAFGGQARAAEKPQLPSPSSAAAHSLSDPYQTYNSAVESFRSGDYQKARDGFSSVSEVAGSKLADDALYNLGNSEAALKNFDAAVAAYEKALSHNQNDKQARDNLAWARERSKKEKDKEKDKNKDKKKDDQKDGKQDDQKKDENKEEKKGDEKDQKSDEQKGDKPGEKDKQDKPGEKDQKDKEKEKDQKGQGKDDAKDQDPQKDGSDKKSEEKNDAEKNGAKKDEMQKEDKKADPQQADSGEEKSGTPDAQPSPGVDSGDAKSGIKVSKREAEVMLQSIEEMSRKEQLKREMRRQKTRQPQSEKDW